MQDGEHKSLPVWQFQTLQDWRKWLELHHSKTDSGIWVKLAKKGAKQVTITYEEAREGALCYGWIDSVPNKVDESFYVLKITPRRPRSIWSQINVDLCELYCINGSMRPSGQKEIDAAKIDGRWARAYGKNDLNALPSDLVSALAAEPALDSSFQSLSSSKKQSILMQLNSAKRPETRLKRLQSILTNLRHS